MHQFDIEPRFALKIWVTKKKLNLFSLYWKTKAHHLFRSLEKEGKEQLNVFFQICDGS